MSTDALPPTNATHLRSRAEPGFWRWLVAIAVLAAVARLVFALVVADDLPLPGDAVRYREAAANLAAGDGYVTRNIVDDEDAPTAEHPPLFPLVLAGFDLTGAEAPGPQRVGFAVLSSIGVVLVGLVGRRAAGPRVGLVAAVIAALHPLWVQPAGMLMSEALYLVVVPLALLAALRALDEPSAGRLAATGAAVGLAGLTRSEGVALAVLLALPLALARRHIGRPVVTGLAWLALGATLVMGPWVVRNRLQVDAWTLSTNGGNTISGANCDRTYSGREIGLWDIECSFAVYAVLLGGPDPDGDGRWEQHETDPELVAAGRRYALDHADRLPAVIAARVGRVWGAYPPEQLRWDVGEGRDRAWQRAGLLLHPLVSVFAIAGTVSLWRRSREATLVLLAPAVLTTVLAVAVFGSTRMRALAEPSLAVLAAAGAMAAWTAMTARLARAA